MGICRSLVVHILDTWFLSHVTPYFLPHNIYLSLLEIFLNVLIYFTSLFNILLPCKIYYSRTMFYSYYVSIFSVMNIKYTHRIVQSWDWMKYLLIRRAICFSISWDACKPGKLGSSLRLHAALIWGSALFVVTDPLLCYAWLLFSALAGKKETIRWSLSVCDV